MSTALAIASVTAVLKDLLNNGLIDHDVSSTTGHVSVTALPPDRIDTTTANPTSQLNLFMYQATPNQGWRNTGLPARNADGESIANPPLALDLHYLLMAFGAEELHGEILLGYAMQLLHENPVLTRDAVRRSLAPPPTFPPGAGLSAGLQTLFTSELAEQVEQIRITPQPMSSEEISKLWAAFQAKYRPTAAYQASVVLIESKRPTRSALPVRARNVYVLPFKQPTIDAILSQAIPAAPIVADQPILVGYALVLAGTQLRDDDTRVSVSGIEVTPPATAIEDTRIVLPVPVGVQAGVQGVTVIHRRLMGTPETPHRGVESNVAAFVLRPRIDSVTVANMHGAGVRSADVQLVVMPAIGPTQRVVLLLNEFPAAPVSPPAPGDPPTLAYAFVAPPRIDPANPPQNLPPPSQSITVPVKDVQAGTYLVRVQVDGAESPLVTETDPTSPNVGRYVAPRITI